MRPLELVGIIFTVVAGMAAVYGLFFGSKPLLNVLKEKRAKRRRGTGLLSDETEKGEMEGVPASGHTTSTGSQRRSGSMVAMASFDQVVEDVKELVSSSQYEEAVRTAKRHRDTMIAIGDEDNPEFQLALGELDVWYAHAQIYTGESNHAIQRLKEVIANLEGRRQRYEGLSLGRRRWHQVLGRAHNHIGYAHWMDLGHYNVALREFDTAIHYFLADRQLEEELATAYDNMGRVYAQLGYQTRAELLIEHGRQIRQRLQNDYRYALSLNSKAIAHLAFGQPFRAKVISEEALGIFGQQQARGERGVGLALLTQGRAQRYLGACWKHSRMPNRFEGHLNEAIETFKKAEEIFVDKVEEDIRLLQAYSELGCTYREKVALSRGGDTESALQATGYLWKLTEDDVKTKYPVLYVDACEDLARTYFLINDRKNANKWIRLAKEAIPGDYKIRKGAKLRAAPRLDYVEEFWQQLGKIYGLCGDLTFDEKDLAIGAPKWRKPVEHYILASCYFGCFLERPRDVIGISTGQRLYPISQPLLMNHRLFIQHLYDRLRQLRDENLLSIREQVLPAMKEAFALEPSWLSVFDKEVLEPLVQVRTTDLAASQDDSLPLA